MTTLRRSDQVRSPMMASAMTEHKIRGQIGQPAASIIENTLPLQESGRHFNRLACFEQAILRYKMMNLRQPVRAECIFRFSTMSVDNSVDAQ
jgi:hypothetical protein